MSAAAIVYRMEVDTDSSRTILHPIGEAMVQPDGKTLAIRLDRTLTLGPADRIIIRGM